MARQRGGRGGGILGAIGGILGRIAEQFGLGRFFGRGRGAPTEPAGTPLPSVAEVVETARREAATPSAPAAARWRWSFRCSWFDRDTGDWLGTSRWNLETNSGTNYDQAYSRARRMSASHMPACVASAQSHGTTLRLSCRRVGTPILL
jgi:hypothetical protein